MTMDGKRHARPWGSTKALEAPYDGDDLIWSPPGVVVATLLNELEAEVKESLKPKVRILRTEIPKMNDPDPAEELAR